MKKKVLICLVVVLILIISIVLGFFILKGGDEKSHNKKLSHEWAEKYYKILNDFKNDDNLKNNKTVYDVHFYDVLEDNPIMVLENNDENYPIADIYYISKDGKVGKLPSYLVNGIELLYNKESGDYQYYYFENSGNISFYHKIADALKTTEVNLFLLNGIAISDSGEDKITRDGKEFISKKFDEVFIKVDVNDKGFSYQVGEDEKQLLNKIVQGENKYQTIEEKVNTDVKKKVQEQLESETINNIIDTSEEVNMVDDNQNNQTNNSSINYVGTYYLALTDGSLAKDGSGTITLNSDGSCSYYSGWSDLMCQSYSVNDHLICLKTGESSSDICFTLTVDNKMLIAPNNEKYMKD